MLNLYQHTAASDFPYLEEPSSIWRLQPLYVKPGTLFYINLRNMAVIVKGMRSTWRQRSHSNPWDTFSESQRRPLPQDLLCHRSSTVVPILVTFGTCTCVILCFPAPFQSWNDSVKAHTLWWEERFANRLTDNTARSFEHLRAVTCNFPISPVVELLGRYRLSDNDVELTPPLEAHSWEAGPPCEWIYWWL